MYISTRFEANRSKNVATGAKKRQKWRYNVITSRRCYVMAVFTHNTMCLCHTHISTKFEANRSRNVAIGAKKPPKMTLLRNTVRTLLRHGDFFTFTWCAYTIRMFPPNLKLIGRKTHSQSRKTYFRALPLPANIEIRKSGSITTRALAIPMMCPNMKMIGWETKKFKHL